MYPLGFLMDKENIKGLILNFDLFSLERCIVAAVFLLSIDANYLRIGATSSP